MTRPHWHRKLHASLFVLMAVLFAAGCSSNNSDENCAVDTSYDPDIKPGAFVAAVDNQYFPLVVGTIFTYAEDGDTVVVTVTDDTKEILGVTCIEVHDVVMHDGEVIEDTYDWYAQDTAGTVWYFGEDTKELEGGVVVTTEGSWEAGVDGAKPGIIMPGHPTVGMIYRQEYFACEAEDKGEILALNASTTVPFGTFTGCIRTHDFTPLDEDINENKYYAPGIGIVLSVDVTGGGREELVSIEAPLE